MPYVYKLTDHMFGDTQQTILGCLNYLAQSRRDALNRTRVSIVFGNGANRRWVGHDLSARKIKNGSVCKERWWEADKYAKEQMYLPFNEYKPARVLGIYMDRFSIIAELHLKYIDDNGAEYTVITTFNSEEGLASEALRSIKAIKIHKRTRHWVEEEEPEVSPFVMRDGDEQCESFQMLSRYLSEQQENLRTYGTRLLQQAIQNGITVTRNHDVYDTVTGDLVGTNCSAQLESLAGPFTPPEYYCGYVTIPGTQEQFCFRIPESRVRYTSANTYQARNRVRESSSRERYAQLYGGQRRHRPEPRYQYQVQMPPLDFCEADWFSSGE